MQYGLPFIPGVFRKSFDNGAGTLENFVRAWDAAPFSDTF